MQSFLSQSGQSRKIEQGWEVGAWGSLFPGCGAEVEAGWSSPLSGWRVGGGSGSSGLWVSVGAEGAGEGIGEGERGWPSP